MTPLDLATIMAGEAVCRDGWYPECDPLDGDDEIEEMHWQQEQDELDRYAYTNAENEDREPGWASDMTGNNSYE